MTASEPSADIVWVRCDAEWPGGSAEEYVAFTRKEWGQMTEEQREAALVEMAETTLINSGCVAGASVVPADEVPDSAKREALR